MTTADFAEQVWELDWEAYDNVSTAQWLAAAMLATYCHELAVDGDDGAICGVHIRDHVDGEILSEVEEFGHEGAFATWHLINTILGFEIALDTNDPRLEKD